jgi:hypothetical protein
MKGQRLMMDSLRFSTLGAIWASECANLIDISCTRICISTVTLQSLEGIATHL